MPMQITGSTGRGGETELPPGGRIPPDLEQVRIRLFSLLGGNLEGYRMLELFAGDGFVGLEALRRGAREVTFVDQSVRVLKTLEKNIECLHCREQAKLLCGDALDVPDVATLDEKFNFIWMNSPSSMFLEASRVEQLFARVTAFLLSKATHEETIVAVRFPSMVTDPLPFSDYQEEPCGQSKLVLLKKSSLESKLLY